MAAIRADKVVNICEEIEKKFSTAEISEIINCLILDEKVQKDIHQDFFSDVPPEKIRLKGLYLWIESIKRGREIESLKEKKLVPSKPIHGNDRLEKLRIKILVNNATINEEKEFYLALDLYHRERLGEKPWRTHPEWYGEVEELKKINSKIE
jgi:hypothetical protein